MHKITTTSIPIGMTFSELRLGRDPQTGGGRDPVAEDLIAEVRAEDAAGQHYSHAPGRA